jgi:hypothetical protein
MELTPGDLLEFGAQHAWPDDELPTTLVRIDGPSLEVVSGHWCSVVRCSGSPR